MKILIGLGNPGPEYQDTRHNIGFMVLDHLVHEISADPVQWQMDKKKQMMTAKIGELLVVKPQSFMNDSGVVVRSLMNFYKAEASDIWVIHDDMDLPLGKIRIRLGGASGGHKGVASIIEAIGTDAFLRFRMGIGRGKEDIEADGEKVSRHKAVIGFVLSRFSQHEAGELRKLIKHGSEAVHLALLDGTDKAMTRFN